MAETSSSAAEPAGKRLVLTRVFEAPRELAFTSYAIPSEGGEAPIEARTTVTFVEQDGKTGVTVEAVVVRAKPEARPALEGMDQGWSESLDRLAALVQRA